MNRTTHLHINAENPTTIGIHSDAEWQEFFSMMKDEIPQSTKRRMNAMDRYSIVTNDILSTIRRKEKDYCYTVHQIADLLAFEPDLKTYFSPKGKYIMVWLD